MDEVKEQVANEQVDTPVVETTPQETPVEAASETVADDKETPTEPTTDLHKHPRFQELNQQKNEYKQRYEEMLYQQKLAEVQKNPVESNDPYATMTPDEAKQTKEFIAKFVMPEMEKKYQPFVQEVQNEKMNKQINDAKSEAGKYGINFDEKLPEIVDYLSRPENRGRLTATEAVRNLYFENIQSSIRSTSMETIQKERDTLTAKKKEANLVNTGVPQNAVIHSDEAARAKMTSQERLAADVRWAMDQANQGNKHPNVR